MTVGKLIQKVRMANGLRVLDSSKGRYTPTHQSVHHLLPERHIRDDEDRLGVEVADHAICQFHDVRLAMLPRVCDRHVSNWEHFGKKGRKETVP